MKIENKIIQLDAADFDIGKICFWRESLFLFDIVRMEMLLLSASGEVAQRVALSEKAGIKQIDAALFNDKYLIAADSLSRQLCRFEIALDGDTFSLNNNSAYPLPAGSEIASIIAVEDGYLLLDKGNSMVRVYDRELQEVKTIGSRMGYILEYEDEQSLRLGFEFPEDIAISGDGNRILVSDSGNKRLVLLNREGKQENVIRLPEFPFKIIAWDEAGDRLLVSDFNRWLMVVSLTYGYIDTIELDHPVDFFPAVFHPRRHVVGSENKNEVVELTIDDTSLETITRKAGNHHVLVRILADGNRLEEARQLVKEHKELLPEYASYSGDADEQIVSALTDHVHERFHKLLEENETLKEEVRTHSREFIRMYKAIPDSEDSEAANIEKENIRHRMFLDLKQYRRNLKSILNLKKAVAGYPTQEKLLKGLLEKRFKTLKPALLKVLEETGKKLDPIDEPGILDAIVRYWLLEEEHQVVYSNWKIDYEKLFGDKFLLAILNDFYFHIAELYRNEFKREQYITFCDREVTMYTDKVNIFTQFIRQLIQWRQFDDVMRMLRKFPDQNKENVNFFYYRVNLAQGNKDAAFMHLKKELDLYSHKVNLIPRLIQLNKLSGAEVQQYIDNILEKSGQSIDTYLHVAQSFFSIGDFEKAEIYVDRELELFPENTVAVILKFDLYNRRETSTISEEYCRGAWNAFKRFIRINRSEVPAQRVFSFFSLLNYIPVEKLDLGEMNGLRKSVVFDDYRKELSIYLSFVKHCLGTVIDEVFEKYETDVYLGARSTSELAYGHYFRKVKLLKDSQQLEEMFTLVEGLLKHHPGDKRIFEFLDKTAGED